jgi:hypothetical protein
VELNRRGPADVIGRTVLAVLQREERDDALLQRIPVGGIVEILKERAGAQNRKRNARLAKIFLSSTLAFRCFVCLSKHSASATLMKIKWSTPAALAASMASRLPKFHVGVGDEWSLGRAFVTVADDDALVGQCDRAVP